MKRFWEWLTISEFGLLIVITIIAVIIIGVMAIKTKIAINEMYNDPDVIVLPEIGSYDPDIDGIMIDSSFHKLLDWYHKQGVWSNSAMIASDKLETANVLDVPVDSVTYQMILDQVTYE